MKQTIEMDYKTYTDKYFLRAKEILEKKNINPTVRYQVFARENIAELKGVNEAVSFIKNNSDAKIYALKDNDYYTAKEPILKIEGKVQDLIELETFYLEILSGNLTGPIDFKEVRYNAREIIKTAKEKPVYYFGARHFHYNLDEGIAKICQEEGFAGCSTDIGAKAWNAKGMGTIPHALILAYAAHMQEKNLHWIPTVETAKAFDKYIDTKVPRVVLIDTFNREIADSIETARALPNLAGVRIDTCGENYAQGTLGWRGRLVPRLVPMLDVQEKYLTGKGVSIAAVWELRQGLDKSGFPDLEIVVSSGFNAEKTAAFMQADKEYQKFYKKPLFNSIGTGSLAKPIMTTSDIYAYFSKKQKKWMPLSKVGRKEIPSTRLVEVT